MSAIFLVLVAFAAAIAALVTGLSTLATYNDLAQRLERLKTLAASERRVAIRKRAVRAEVTRHVRAATRHEQRTIGRAAGRGGRRARGGSLIDVRDTSNGWPRAEAVGTAERGLAASVDAQDQHLLAWHQLHEEAQQYNGLLRSVPALFVARLFGFRPWRLNTSTGRRFRRAAKR